MKRYLRDAFWKHILLFIAWHDNEERQPIDCSMTLDRISNVVHSMRPDNAIARCPPLAPKMGLR